MDIRPRPPRLASPPTAADAPARAEPFGRPRLLAPDDPVLLVRRGFIDIFWVELRDGSTSGARRHLLRVETGSAIFGTPVFSAEDLPSGGLLAAGGLDCEILAVSRADFLQGADAAVAIDSWIVGLARAAWPHPTGDRHVIAPVGQRIDLARDVALHAPPRSVVWLSLIDGVLDLGDGPGSDVWPITEEAGAQATVDSQVECFGTQAALGRLGSSMAAAIDRFHRRALARLARRCAEDDTAIVHHRAAGERAAESDFLADFSQLARVAGSRRKSSAGAVAGSGEPAIAATRLVADALGVTLPAIPPPAEPVSAFERVTQIADAANLRYRRVVLHGRWWLGDHGPLVAFRADDRSPVALLPHGDRYRIVDPQSGAERLVDPRLQAEIGGEALALYRPLPGKPLSLRHLVRFARRGTASDGLRIALASLAIGLLALVVPLSVGAIFDTVVPHAERGLLRDLIGGLIVVALSGALFEAVRAIALIRVEGRIEWSLQSAIVDRLLALPASFFKSFSSGDLADRLLGFDAMREVLAGNAVTSVVAFIFSSLNFILLFVLDARLAIVAVALIGLWVAITVMFSTAQLRHQSARFEQRGKLSGLVNQLVIGITKLRIAAREQRAAGVWARHSARLTVHVIGARRYEALTQVVTETFPLLALGVAFFVVVEQLPRASTAATSLSVGHFLAFMAAFSQLLAALTALALALTQSLTAIPLYRRAAPILLATPEARVPGGPPLRLKGEIEIQRVTFRYSKNEPPVLDDVSLAIAPGEFVAVVGSSGSGKSTLMRLLLGFEKPETGSILFDGRPIEHLDLAAIRRDMGVVLQSGKPSPGSLYENIVGHTGLPVEEAMAAARLVGLDRDIEAMPMGLHTVLMEGGQTLSGGQRQRLMIARALVRRPRILLFDEATSALDNRSQAIVTASLAQLSVTRVVVAHRLSTIQSADRIVVLDHGHVVESGSYDSLIAAGGPFAALARRQLL